MSCRWRRRFPLEDDRGGRSRAPAVRADVHAPRPRPDPRPRGASAARAVAWRSSRRSTAAAVPYGRGGARRTRHRASRPGRSARRRLRSVGHLRRSRSVRRVEWPPRRREGRVARRRRAPFCSTRARPRSRSRTTAAASSTAASTPRRRWSTWSTRVAATAPRSTSTADSDRAADVLRALALGARAVMLGRPVLWGLAIGGEPGARAVLDAFAHDLRRTMAFCGAASLAESTGSARALTLLVDLSPIARAWPLRGTVC